MKAFEKLDGSTRVLSIVGDPIAQVKSPGGVTQSLIDAGLNAVVIPCHVAPADLDVHMRGISVVKNFDGVIVTVPHKFAAYTHCTTATDRARFLGAANVLRRNDDGSWHGDMCDGQAFVDGIRVAGCHPEGQAALLVGAGGAGSAIGLALLEAGVARLAIHDGDTARRDQLIGVGSSDPSDYTLVANATPMGMKTGDPFPVQTDKLHAGMFVGDVITAPAISPLIEAARAVGCATQTGGGMFAAVRELIQAFLLESGPLAHAQRT
jgi:shikimate dehydrogenase